MLKYIASILILFNSFVVLGQSVYEPQILILSPANIKTDKVFDKEIAEYENRMREHLKAENSTPNVPEEKQPENIKRMLQSEKDFMKSISFINEISSMSERYLAYRFFEHFPNLLILLKNTKSDGSLAFLQNLSAKEKLQYVLNFQSLELYKKDGVSYAKMAVQLYDNTTNSIIIDKAYTGDWQNHGFEFSCQDSSINCTINNALSQVLADVIESIAKNSPTLKKARQLGQDRFDILMSKYYHQLYDNAIVKQAIPTNDSNIDLNTIYDCIVCPDKTKFVAFFIEHKGKQDFKSLSEDKKDNNVQIVTSKNITDSGYLDDMPAIQASIVKAVKYKGKWYYEKANVTYFEAENLYEGKKQYFNNLQGWDFFKEGTTDFNPNFWETNLFQKIKDLKKDPDWAKYGDGMWKREEMENRDYIGMYEIVADELKKEKGQTPDVPKVITIH